MKVMLFLGSGVSLTSGMPCTKQITESILNDDLSENNDLLSILGGPVPPPYRKEYLTERVHPFVRFLKNVAAPYLGEKGKGCANYEDIAYLAQQIQDEYGEDIYNPAIVPFVEVIEKYARVLSQPFPGMDVEISLKDLSNAAVHFIRYVVWKYLTVEKDPKGLDVVHDLASRVR